LGIPGQQLVVVTAPTSDQDVTRDKPAGTAGTYQVTYVLGKTSQPPGTEGHVEPASHFFGTSYLQLHSAKILNGELYPMTGGSDDGTTTLSLRLSVNEEGMLGKIECDPFDALDFVDAHSTSYRVVATFLNYLAVHAVLPLHIAQTDIVELATGAWRVITRLSAATT
jgi:hypothetical protein